MSKVRGANSRLERLVFDTLKKNRVIFKKHQLSLLGRPDIVIERKKLAIFVHSDFWHGWNFPRWRSNLPSTFWVKKIADTRKRDRRIIRRLKPADWNVMVIWEHQLDGSGAILDAIIRRIQY